MLLSRKYSKRLPVLGNRALRRISGLKRERE
jgi:hypothetical protein